MDALKSLVILLLVLSVVAGMSRDKRGNKWCLAFGCRRKNPSSQVCAEINLRTSVSYSENVAHHYENKTQENPKRGNGLQPSS